MKNVISTLIVSTFLSAGPAMAAETETPIPQDLSNLGITSQDINANQDGIANEPTDSEMSTLQWGRRCPWGYVLRAYRIRIGRFWVTRYRCVRYGYPRYPRYPHRPFNSGDMNTQQSDAQPNLSESVN